ncbi:hypothetical protein IBL25_06805, partial [Roseomonas ludipueritiae]|nr:hypothetical protein [Pseudoroseomonas ludipueritiae]
MVDAESLRALRAVQRMLVQGGDGAPASLVGGTIATDGAVPGQAEAHGAMPAAEGIGLPPLHAARLAAEAPLPENAHIQPAPLSLTEPSSSTAPSPLLTLRIPAAAETPDLSFTMAQPPDGPLPDAAPPGAPVVDINVQPPAAVAGLEPAAAPSLPVAPRPVSSEAATVPTPSHEWPAEPSAVAPEGVDTQHAMPETPPREAPVVPNEPSMPEEPEPEEPPVVVP